MAAVDRIFASVFPPPSDIDIPTPTATPVLGSSGSGEPFGSLHPSHNSHESSAAEQIKWDRAWHIATVYLTLSPEPIEAYKTGSNYKGRWIKPVSHEIGKALEYLLSDQSRGYQIRKASGKDDLLRWYFEEIVLAHYLQYALPSLVKVVHLIYRNFMKFSFLSGTSRRPSSRRFVSTWTAITGHPACIPASCDRKYSPDPI